MSRRKTAIIVVVGLLPVILAAAAAVVIVVNPGMLLPGKPTSASDFTEAAWPIEMYPDYSGVTIPPNIAPLNFQITQHDADKFFLKVSADNGQAIEVTSGDGVMRIPQGPWRKLLAANAGGELRMDVYARIPGKPPWVHFETIRNRIAADDIDRYAVYRMMPPIYNMWQDMTIRHRDLTSFQERIVMDNRRDTDPDGKTSVCSCVNCHTFLNRRADTMLLHARPGGGKWQGPSMLVIKDGKATKIDTRSGDEPPAAYVSWHPSGRLVAFSRNSLWQMFHTAGVETRDVVDRDSDLGIYRLDTGETLSPAPIARADRLETFPTWSPDGKYLYFCSAPVLWQDKKKPAMDLYQKVQYDLVRVPFDIETGKWGTAETVVAAADIGKSISEPRISPDGRWLMFCGHQYGSFPIYQPSSDLYMIDLSSCPSTSTSSATSQTHMATRFMNMQAINSDQCDSYHSWSSSSRWVIFTSKREDGIFARLYITHIDSEGNAAKPFMLPQEDPTSNGRCLLTYNLPEFVLDEVKVTGGEIVRAINSEASRPKSSASRPIITGATPKKPAGASSGDEPWTAPN